MGLKLSRAFKSVVRRAPEIVGGFARGGFVGAGLAAIAPRQRAPVGAFIPALATTQFTGGMIPAVEMIPPVNGGMMPVAGPGAGLIAAGVATAIGKLAQRLGMALSPTVASFTRVGRRIWGSITAFTARHPGTSAVAMLVALGLSVEEASEFLIWGQRRRRRRRRGISAADLRTTKRTVRKVLNIVRDLRGLSGGGGLAIARARARGRRRDGTIIAQTS